MLALLSCLYSFPLSEKSNFFHIGVSDFIDRNRHPSTTNDVRQDCGHHAADTSLELHGVWITYPGPWACGWTGVAVERSKPVAEPEQADN